MPTEETRARSTDEMDEDSGTIACPHCGDEESRSDYGITLGSYYFDVDCLNCRKPFRIGVAFHIEVQAL